MSAPATLLTRQFLAWVARRPRSYGETREAWRSTCPLNCAWEDALAADLVRLDGGGGRVSDRSPVVLTARGRALLDGG
jgi:hypothetical protein